MAFSQVHGQDRALNVLRAALTSGRIAGGYLFVGPPGVGKHFTAVQFAKALNCRESREDACDTCPNCRLIDKGEFPDLYVPQRQGRLIVKGNRAERGKGHLVDIVVRLHYRPVMGRTKVVLIDPADAMTEEAGNMLLKTLEEPPPDTVFILVTTLETAVLPTLVSRCQRLRFPPLKRADLVACLAGTQGLDEEAAGRLAAAAQGSVERALELNASHLLEQKLEILDYLLATFEAPLSQRVEAALERLKAGGKDREVLEQIGTIVSMFARDLLSASCGVGGDELLFPERREAIEALAGRVGRDGALAVADVARELFAGMGRNENPRHLLYFLGHRLVALQRSARPTPSNQENPHAGS